MRLEHRFSALRIRGGFVLSCNGQARYRAAEITARLSWKHGEWFLSYTRSRSQGDLNDFSGFLGNDPMPLIRPDVYSTTGADLPNRFLAWGTLRLPWKMQLLPLIEYRNGLPYAQYDAFGNYAGVPNVTGNNLMRHFNPLAVHADIADPAFGIFFGNYPRRFRADFDVLF